MSNLYRVVLTFMVAMLVTTMMIGQTYPPSGLVAEGGLGEIQLTWETPSNPNAQGFESGDIPSSWLAVDQDDDGYNFEVWDSFVNSGSYAAASFSYINYVGAAQPNNYLITPQFSATSSTSLSFYVGCSDDEWFLEHYSVLVSTSGTAIADFTDNVHEETLGSEVAGMFKLVQIDLSAYDGQDIYIAFRHHDVTDQFNVTFDDMLVEGTAAPNKNWVADFEDPSDIEQFTMASVPTKLALDATMQDAKEAYDKALSSRKVNSNKAFQSYTVYRDGSSIATGVTTNYYTDTEMSYGVEHTYKVTAVYDEGESAASNEASATATDPGNIIFFDDFEGGMLGDEYTVVDANSDTYTWEAYNSASYAYSGEYSLNIRWNSSLAMNDWVFIGPFNLDDAESYGLSFYHKTTSSFPENYSGHITTATDGSGIVADLFAFENYSNSEYVEWSDEFTVPSTGEYYIAFYGYSDADMFRICIDDVMLSGAEGSAVGFMADLTVADAGGGESSETLTFGMKEDATDGLDAAYNELELPPVGPAGVFDARFIYVDETTASLSDVRGVATEAEWELKFQPGDSGYPFTISWDPTQLGDGSFHLMDALGGVVHDVDMKTTSSLEVTNSSVNTLVIAYTSMMSMDMEVAAGWNMVSVPVHADDMAVSSLFANATSDAFMFDNGYQTVTEMAMGAGYWLKYDAAETVSVSGMDDAMPVAVNAGWNMIGGFHYTAAVADLSTDPSDIIDSDFFGFDNGYSTASELMPGHGYWVKASQAGTITMNMPVVKKSKPTEEMDALYTISMMVSDNGTGSYALGLGLDPNATEGIDSDLGETELPPMPPTGVFDARLMLPDGTTSSPMDYRTGDAGYSGTVEYDLSWQYSSGADALTLDIVIPEVPGTVEMTIVDGFGGAVFSQVVEEGTTQVVVDNANLSALNLNIAYTAPIPVELTGFAANVAGESINLEWSTATETNNKGFEVERSEDGENFSKIAFVDGMGTTTEAQSYIFTDRNAVGGTYYYRLRQVDFDGTYAYSDVVEVEFVPSEYSLQQNYPNPFNPSTTIKFALPVEAKVTVTLYNALGQRVNEIVSNNFTAGVQTVNFNASELASGMYIYQISAQGVDGSNFVDTKKMMLMK